MSKLALEMKIECDGVVFGFQHEMSKEELCDQALVEKAAKMLGDMTCRQWNNAHIESLKADSEAKRNKAAEASMRIAEAVALKNIVAAVFGKE